MLGGIAFLVLLEVALRVLPLLALPSRSPGDAAGGVCAAEDRVLCVGDSFTMGIGAGEGESYPWQLQQVLEQRLGRPVCVINGGIGGANTDTVLSALPGLLEAHRPAVVVALAGGTNLVNFRGYQRFRERGRVAVLLDELSDRLRVLRLVRLAIRQLDRDAAAQAELALAERPGAAYLAWHGRRSPDAWRGTAGELCLTGLGLLGDAEARAARERFEEALALDPDSACAAWGLGTVLRQQHAYPEATRWFERARSLDPADPFAHRSLGELQLDQMRHGDEALRHFEEGIRAAPNYGANYCFLAAIHARQQRGDQVFELIEQGLSRAPEEVYCYVELVGIGRSTGRWDRVRAILDEASSRSQTARSYRALIGESGLEDAVSRWIHGDIERIVALAEASGAEVVLQDYPSPSLVDSILDDIARVHGLPFVSNGARFGRRLASGTPREALFAQDMHCNGAGYRLMAENVADTLLAEGLLEAARPGP